MNEQEYKVVNIGELVRPIPPVRQKFDEEELDILTESIRVEGIISPLTVRPKNGKYEVIDGDSRLHAAFKAGLREVPVVVRDVDDRTVHVLRILSNTNRSNPDTVSEAKYIAHVISQGDFGVKEYAEQLGHGIKWVNDRLTIAEMPDYMQDGLTDKKVPLGVALELFQIKDDRIRYNYFREAARSGMSVQSAKVSMLQANEAIEALEERDEPVNAENVPVVVRTPMVQCELSGQQLPIHETRMVRVGINYWSEFINSLNQQANDRTVNTEA